MKKRLHIEPFDLTYFTKAFESNDITIGFPSSSSSSELPRRKKWWLQNCTLAALGMRSKSDSYLLLNGQLKTPFTNVTTSTVLGKLFQVIRSALPFILFLIIYALNKVIHIQPTIEDLGCVHIHTINAIEEYILGFHPHKIISAHHTLFFDALASVPYLIHYGIPVVFPLYLLVTGKSDDILKYYWLLGWLMWFSYLIWLVFPHTPPWVIDNIEQHNSTMSIAMQHKEGCAFARLDAYTGNNFFHNMFNGNPIPFGCFPSGHVAWPTIVYLIGAPGGNFFLLYILWVSWATLYSCHHYLLDAVGAVVCVVLTKKVLTYLADKNVCSADYKCRPNSIACPFQV